MFDLPYTVDPAGMRRCKCVKNHTPEPRELHRHHVWPEGKGGPTITENLRWLCPTTHSNVHKLWRAYEKQKGEPSGIITRQYNSYVQRLVADGWAQMMGATGGQPDVSAPEV